MNGDFHVDNESLIILERFSDTAKANYTRYFSIIICN